MLEKAEATAVKFGAYAILFGRFMAPIRSIVPLLTGVSGMTRLKYTIYDVIACAVWTSALGLLIVGLDQLWH